MKSYIALIENLRGGMKYTNQIRFIITFESDNRWQIRPRLKLLKWIRVTDGTYPYFSTGEI